MKKKATTSATTTLAKSFWGYDLAQEEREMKRRAEIAHAERLKRVAEEQAELRAEAAEKQNERFDESQELIRCAHCNKIFWKKVTYGYFPEDLCDDCLTLWRDGNI